MLYKSRCCRGYSCEAFFISWWLEKAGAQSNHGQHCKTRWKPPSAVAHQGGFLQQEPSQGFWVAGLLPECHCCLGVSLEGVRSQLVLAGLLLGPPVRRWEAVQGLVAVRAMPSAPLGAVGCSVGWWDLVWPTSSSTQGDLTQDAPTPRGSVVKVSSVQLSFIRNASKKCLIL